jgi:hypothetical protein
VTRLFWRLRANTLASAVHHRGVRLTLDNRTKPKPLFGAKTGRLERPQGQFLKKSALARPSL